MTEQKEVWVCPKCDYLEVHDEKGELGEVWGEGYLIDQGAMKKFRIQLVPRSDEGDGGGQAMSDDESIDMEMIKKYAPKNPVQPTPSTAGTWGTYDTIPDPVDKLMQAPKPIECTPRLDEIERRLDDLERLYVLLVEEGKR